MYDLTKNFFYQIWMKNVDDYLRKFWSVERKSILDKKIAWLKNCVRLQKFVLQENLVQGGVLVQGGLVSAGFGSPGNCTIAKTALIGDVSISTYF